jgi:hypothetical protein
VYSVELRPRSRAWLPPVRSIDHLPPRVRELRSVSDTEPLADVVAAPGGEGWLLATLTQFDESTPYVKRKTPAPDGRFGPVRAQLTLRTLHRNGKVLGTPQVLSYRARAPGGLALSGSADRSLLLWTALDKMRPEVFATLLRPGKAPQQKMLTQAAGQVSQLAAAVLPQGFMAAWISDPNGDAQVWGARLGPDLTPLAPPAALTRGPGAAVGLSLARRGDTAWLAWVQGGDHEQRLLAARLDSATGAASGEPRVLRRSEAGTLVSPVLVSRAEGALLAWIERPVVGNGGGSAWLLELDAELKPRGEPRAVRSPSGDARAVRLSCDGERCIGSIDGRPPNGALLEGFAWSPSGSGSAPAEELSARQLIWRASASVDPAAFALAGEHVFYGDRRSQSGLLRRVGVEWP